jgi:hypothetical protein
VARRCALVEQREQRGDARIASDAPPQVQPGVDRVCILPRQGAGGPLREQAATGTLVERAIRTVLQHDQVHRAQPRSEHGAPREFEQPAADTRALVRLQHVDRVQLGVAVPARLARRPDIDESDNALTLRLGDVHPVERCVEPAPEQVGAAFDGRVAGHQRRAIRERLLPGTDVDLGGSDTVGHGRRAQGDAGQRGSHR